MKKDSVKNVSIFGIILVFLGANILPNVCADTQSMSIKKIEFKKSNEIATNTLNCDFNIAAAVGPTLLGYPTICDITVYDKSRNYPLDAVEIYVTIDVPWDGYYALDFNNVTKIGHGELTPDWPHNLELKTYNVTLTVNPLGGATETNWTDNSISFKITPYYYNGFLIGSLTNMTETENTLILTANQLFSLNIFPIRFNPLNNLTKTQIFSDNEKIVILKNSYFGTITPTFIAAAFYFKESVYPFLITRTRKTIPILSLHP